MNQKVAVVVGAGPGLGRALAHRFAAEGFAVALMARNQAKLDTLATDIEQKGNKALPVSVDITDAAAVEKAFSIVRSKLGDPQVLLYNAGIFQMGGVLDIDPDTFEQSWRISCYGAYLAAREVLPAMQKNQRGTILLTGATAAMRGGAKFAAFASGKFGLRALSQSMAREFASQGIHVAHIAIDGQISSPDREKQQSREGALLLPDAIAETYWQLHQQNPTAWTQELDLRPAIENF